MRPDFSQIRQTLKNFFGRVAVLRGPCYKDIMGGFFLRPDFSQIRQTLKFFWKGGRFEGSV